MVSLLSFFTHKFFKILLALYISTFLLIWLISSPLIKHLIAPVLIEKQLHLSDDSSIRFNPFLMRFTLNNINLFSSKKKPKEAVFSLLNMEVQVALWQLALNKIVLSKFLLEQGTLKITQHDNQLIIAGIEIHSSTKETVDGSTSSFPYQLILPDFLLSQFTIVIEKDTQKQKNQTHHIAIEQLTLSQVKATKNKQQANLTLIALIDKAHLAFTANTRLISGKGDINSNINLKNYPIEKLVPYVKQLTKLKGSLSVNSQQTITLAEQGLNIKVKNAGIKLQDILVGLEQQYLTLNNFQVNVTELAIDLQNNTITHLAGQSSIKLTDAEFNNNESKAQIATFKQLAVDDIHFVLDKEPSIDITKVVLDEFIFSKKVTLTDTLAQKLIDRINVRSTEDGLDIAAADIVKLPPVMQLKQLTLSNLHIHKKSIAVNAIIFDNLTSKIIINENKNIINLVKLSSESAQQSIVEPNSNKTKANSDNFAFSFNELRFINKNTFDFTDFSVDPIYQRTFFLDTLNVGALSNRKEKQQDKTPFILAGRSNKYANFNLTGYLQPFSELASYHAKGYFKELSLPALSSYLKASTGIEVKTGQLNTTLDLTLSGDQINGNVVVLLQALETGLVDSKEVGSLIDQGALPLNMAMGMLKDSDGNVELNVPLSGAISDPKFGLSSIVTLITKKAIMSATQDYLMTTFVPYANIVSIAITAGEFALKLRFDDLEYQVKQIKPDNQQSAYLNDFIALMKNKKDTRVTICAISTPADIGLKSGISVTEKSDIKRLIELGEKREHAFKDHLIEQGKINSSRILFCKPQIDSDKDAIPRIVISV